MQLRKITFPIIAWIIIFSSFSFRAYAHPGRTDSNNGHTDHSTGEYHYHHGQEAHGHYDTDGDGDLDCPYDFKSSSKTPSSSPEKREFAIMYDSGYAEGYDDGIAWGQMERTAFAKIQQSYEDKIYDLNVTLGICIFLSLIAIFITWRKLLRKNEEIKRLSQMLEYQRQGHAKLKADLAVATRNVKPITAETSEKPIRPIIPDNNQPQQSIQKTSSNRIGISFIDYRESTLIVVFKNGAGYHHYNVPQSVYIAFTSASSKEDYYNIYIRNVYPRW